MENKSHALAAGLFILALTALLVSAAMWLTRDTSALATFELAGNVNVAGLQPQATVRLRGVPVGKVQDIRLDPAAPGQVLVSIAVDAQAPISSATQASLGYQGVTGLAFIALEDGGAPGTALAPGSRIPLKPGLMGRLTDQGERILAQLETAGTRINQLLAPDNQQVAATHPASAPGLARTGAGQPRHAGQPESHLGRRGPQCRRSACLGLRISPGDPAHVRRRRHAGPARPRG